MIWGESWSVWGINSLSTQKLLLTVLVAFRFDLGNEEGSLNNHYDIVVKYHPRPNGVFRVVGVMVWPSVCHFLVAPIIVTKHLNPNPVYRVNIDVEAMHPSHAVAHLMDH
jgi:hypothetical protein